MKYDFEGLKSYYLMNKNVPVLEFLYDEETHNIFRVSKILNGKYAPVGLINAKTGISHKAFSDWWKARAIPASRENISRVMQSLKIGSTLELLEKCAGLSLSDQYWIKRTDPDVQWKDLNFFENEFSEDIGRILLGQSSRKLNLNLVSPDNASDGDLPKKWKIINGERYLIKGGNSLNNQEPFNEVIAARLFERILNEDDYVSYFLIEEDGKAYSACKTMVSTEEELVSGYAIDSTIKQRSDESNYQHYVKACEALGIKDVEIKLAKMLTCDYIIGNYDRHYRNFGAIRNVETLEWQGIAPIFDSGSSLWAKTPTQEIFSSQYKARCFKSNPKEQFMLVSDLSWLDENKLIGFENDVSDILSQNPLMDEKRILYISKFVSSRIKEVIERKKELNPLSKPLLDETIALCELKKQTGNNSLKGIEIEDKEK